MRSFRIGSAFGIPVKFDLTFLIILPIFAWIIGSRIAERVEILNSAFGVSIAAEPLTSGSMPWLLGTIVAIGLFAGVVLHEFGHSLVAQYYNYPIDSITLWIFGGISQFAEMPEDWRHEIAIAIAGPIVSIVLGVLSYVIFRTLPVGANALAFVVGYLGIINVALAGFNLLPAFPLDGGRILRALLARTRSYAAATQLAAGVGKGFAVLLGLVGLAGFNVILIGIAFFVYMGAASEAQRTVMQAAFDGTAVRDLMTPADEIDEATPETEVSTLLDRMFQEAHTAYPVTKDGDIVGIAGLQDVQSIESEQWGGLTVTEVMRTEYPSVSPSMDVMEAFEEMQESGGDLAAVVDDTGEFVGVLTRTDVMTAFEVVQSGEALPAPQQRRSGVLSTG